MPNENVDKIKEKMDGFSSKLKGFFKRKLGNVENQKGTHGTVLLYVISNIGGEESRHTINPSLDIDFNTLKIMVGELLNLKPSDFIINLYGESTEGEKETLADIDVQDEDELIITAK